MSEPAARRDVERLIYALAPQFNRNLGAGVIGPMVRALDGLLRDHPEHHEIALPSVLLRALENRRQ